MDNEQRVAAEMQRNRGILGGLCSLASGLCEAGRSAALGAKTAAILPRRGDRGEGAAPRLFGDLVIGHHLCFVAAIAAIAVRALLLLRYSAIS